MNNPRIAFMGAGATGSYLGAYLTQAGYAPTLIDPWPEHVDKMKSTGLRASGSQGDFTVPAKVVTKGSDGGPYDVIVVACKAYDLPSAIDAIAPAVGAHTTIVPILNGHAHFATLDARFGKDKVAGGLARIEQGALKDRAIGVLRDPREAIERFG